jgi:hypothetical protein
VKAPAYWASDGDWLPLAENFGLAPYLEDKASAQPDQGAREWILSPQEVKAAAKSRRDRGPWGLIILAGFALLFFVIGGVDFAQYRAGTPTTATVTYCGTGKGSGCTGTWSIGGVSQTGPIKLWFGHPSVGSSVDVRVSGGDARTPTSCLVFVVAGGCVLAFSIFMFVATRDRTTGPGSVRNKGFIRDR